jgi:4-amino-4-deoxy-L-arabinose transferase-like glycosyltransferase
MDTMGWIRLKGPVWVVVLALLSNLVILWDAPRLVAFAAGFMLTCLLPGYLLTRVVLLGDDTLDRLEGAVLTPGTGFAALILGALGLHYLPGPLTRTLILVFYDGLILLLVLVLFLRRGAGAASTDRASTWHRWLLLALVLVAAFFRLGNLGYSEFQGDEARALLMAAGVVRGEDDILFLHRKGPMEVLLPAAFYALHGTTDELTARLPFALASLTGLVSVYVLIRRLFPRRDLAAPVAVGLLAVDGYLVAFGRIVQYQSLVFLMMALAAWCSCAWSRGGDRVLGWLAALFLAVGMLAHYEAIAVAPFVIWLFCARARREGWPLRRWAQQALVPGLVLAVVVGAFYVPYIRHPHFAATAQYITGERVGGELLYNNLSDFFWRATFYNSTYYIVFLILGLLALVIYRLYASLLPAFLGVAGPVIFAAGMVVAAFSPKMLVIGELNLALLPFAVAMAALIASSRVTAEFKATFLWFGLPCLVALFLTRKPKNHIYLLFPAWATLVGVAVSGFVAAFDRRVERSLWMARIQRIVLILGGVGLLAVFGYYIHVVFVRHTPNYLQGYPAARPSFYLTIHGDQLPRVGYFGFPHRSGWKAVGALYAQGVLQGSYGSNEEPLITSWYTRGAAWCPDGADYYFITSPIQDAVPIPVDDIRDEHYLLGRVSSDGHPMLEIYGRQPVDAPADYDLAELEGGLDAATQPDVWLWALRDPVPQYRVDARLGEQVLLLGLDAPRQVAAGGVQSLVLYWQALAPLDRDYNVFVHIEVEGDRIWGQSDGPPACGAEPTEEWQPGRTVVDGHSLMLDPAAPPGEYPLLVGLYDPMTGERVPVVGRDANPSGNAVYLGTVEVVAPPYGEEP